MQNVYCKRNFRPSYHYLTSTIYWHFQTYGLLVKFHKNLFFSISNLSTCSTWIPGFIVESFDISVIAYFIWKTIRNAISNNNIKQDTTSHLLFLIKVLFDFLFSSRLTRIELGIKLNSNVMRGEKEWKIAFIIFSMNFSFSLSLSLLFGTSNIYRASSIWYTFCIYLMYRENTINDWCKYWNILQYLQNITIQNK